MSRSCVHGHKCAFMVTIVFMIMMILATIMLVITLMIVVTGSAKAVSVRCAVHLGYRGVAERCTIRARISWHPRPDPPRVGGLLGEALPLP
jgi:hypothetical protein